jgi:hypothetical protein
MSLPPANDDRRKERLPPAQVKPRTKATSRRAASWSAMKAFFPLLPFVAALSLLACQSDDGPVVPVIVTIIAIGLLLYARWMRSRGVLR